MERMEIYINYAAEGAYSVNVTAAKKVLKRLKQEFEEHIDCGHGKEKNYEFILHYNNKKDEGHDHVGYYDLCQKCAEKVGIINLVKKGSLMKIKREERKPNYNTLVYAVGSWLYNTTGMGYTKALKVAGSGVPLAFITLMFLSLLIIPSLIQNRNIAVILMMGLVLFWLLLPIYLLPRLIIKNKKWNRQSLSMTFTRK